MEAFRLVLRLGQIAAVLGRALASALWWSAWEGSWAPAGESLRRAFERLGPAFVKLGQFLSVRPDLVPPGALAELERLQDATGPLPLPEVMALLERELDAPVGRLFAHFEAVPTASASVSQVHRAVLHGGEAVAVKIQKPDAERSIRRDLRLVGVLLRATVGWTPLRRRVDLVSLWAEVVEASEVELDFRREAEAAEAMARSFREWPGIRIPRVHWAFTTRRVLTAEFIAGTKISDVALRRRDEYAGLAELGARAFLKQVLVDGFFHADLHPANILVTPEGEIAYLDFGIVGRLTDSERRAAVGALAGLLSGDASLAVRNLQALGIAIPSDRRSAFGSDILASVQHVLTSRLADVSVVGLAKALFGAARRHRVAFPRTCALLLKGLLTIEGTARGLHPDFRFEHAIRSHFLAELRGTVSFTALVEACWRGAALLGFAALCASDGESTGRSG
ncbi:MAG: hypothetical protein HY900_35920 [Deltaproteobacteria bacterium]|nr:hypothetical protein [Deltaproteobacteria bacterium]